jgi:hypothetical protein
VSPRTVKTVIRPPASTAASTVDYDLHGLVGIRLVDPSSHDLAAVEADIGTMKKTLDREPEITIRFAHELPTSGVLRYVQPQEAGFTEDAFFVMADGSGGAPAARIPFDLIGQPCEILCRSGLPTVPLLRPIVNVAMLTKDAVALHASAFTYRGKGTLVAGWARGGKTSSLLAFMRGGGEFIADDHVYLSSDGNRLYGSPEPVSLRAWHLEELPDYRQQTNWRELSHLGASKVLGRVATAIGGSRAPTTLRKVADRVARVAEDAYVPVSPDRLFSRRSSSGKLDKAFLAIAQDSRDVLIEQVDGAWLADRLVLLLQSERRRLLANYLAFRFAFPSKPNDLIEHASDIERTILVRVLAEADSYVVYHPFPAPVDELFAAMEPAILS